MTSSFDVGAFRAQFPSLPALTYINSGSYGLLSTKVRSAFDSYLDGRIAKGADWGGWVQALEKTRSLMAQILSVEADEVAITASASAGINAIATAFDFKKRPKVLLSNFEFPTSGQIWHAQEQSGAQIIHVPEAEDGTMPVEHFANLIDEQTAIVALSQVCYRHGGRIPDADIRAIADIAHKHGALVILDTFQIIGTQRIEPRALGVDICVGGMLKYLLGTAGVGFLYVARDQIEALVPRTSGWFAQADIDTMDIFANTPSPTARRFEGGTPPVPSCIASNAGLEIILEIGLDGIGDQIAAITSHTLQRLQDEGIAFANPAALESRGPLISVPARDENALVQALAARNIITSCRDGNLRAGFHAHNDQNDVEALIAGLIAHRNLLV